jgi:hypothetical protein
MSSVAQFQTVVHSDGSVGGGYILSTEREKSFAVPAGMYLAPRPMKGGILGEDILDIVPISALNDDMIDKLFHKADEKPRQTKRKRTKTPGTRKTRAKRHSTSSH